jgi:chromosome segregation ATPase
LDLPQLAAAVPPLHQPPLALPQSKAQAEAQRARQAEEERGELQRRLDDARGEAARLAAEAERWRAGRAALASALAAAQKGLEGLP